MFLHQDFLKIMLGANHQSAKQFGECLAKMCRGEWALSRKVSKVFVRAVNGSTSDNLRAYLKALKPFLRADDELKHARLEWVFGFAQVNQRKTYREDKYKYGLELIDRINEDATTYMTPLLVGPNEESLFQQLLKCKGKQDTSCILCLKEMLSLMASDDAIGRFVYQTPPHTYQFARFTDWFAYYLENQRQDTEKSSSYNSYFKNKHDSVVKSLAYLERVQERFKVYKEEERAAYERAKTEDGKEFEEIEKDWLAYQNPNVIEHYPPQVIVGRQVAEDRELAVFDDDPNVRVSVYEIPCEYNYSNPTGFFNVSLPHIEAKVAMYQTMSYVQYMRTLQENEKRKEGTEGECGEDSTQISTSDTGGQADQPKDPQEQEVDNGDCSVQVVDWFQRVKTDPPTMLKVLVTNKTRKKVSVKVSFEGGHGTNALLPHTSLKEVFFDNDTRLLCHLVKCDPRKAQWGNLRVTVETKEKGLDVGPKQHSAAPAINIRGLTSTYGVNSDNI